MIDCVDFLSGMHEENTDSADDFLQYTTLWIQKGNRGGLFVIDNDTYLLFRAMELVVHQVMNIEQICYQPLHLNLIGRKINSKILNDPGVMAHWNYILSKSELLDGK